MDSNQELEKSGNFGRGQKPLFTEAYDYMAILDHILETLGKTAYRFAIRNYITDRIEYDRVIEYQDYGKLSFIETQDVVGVPLPEIYNQYWAYKLHKQHENPRLSESLVKKVKRKTGKDIEKMKSVRSKK